MFRQWNRNEVLVYYLHRNNKDHHWFQTVVFHNPAIANAKAVSGKHPTALLTILPPQKKSFMKNTFTVIVLCIVLTSFQCEHNQITNDFIGIWTLQKCVAKQKDGKVNYPYGEKPVGQLLYDEKGNMMVEIMKPGIKKFASANLLQGTPEEILPAYYGFIAYYGTYKMVPDSNLVIHHLKACSFPNWVDQDQRRYYEFKNKQLILTTSFIGLEQYELTWQKVE